MTMMVKPQRRSTRPTVEVRSIVEEFERKMAEQSQLEASIAGVQAAIKSLAEEKDALREKLMDELAGYEYGLVKVNGIEYKLIPGYERTSTKPQWKKFVVWAMEKFASMDKRVYQEAQKFYRSCFEPVTVDRDLDRKVIS